MAWGICLISLVFLLLLAYLITEIANAVQAHRRAKREQSAGKDPAQLGGLAKDITLGVAQSSINDLYRKYQDMDQRLRKLEGKS